MKKRIDNYLKKNLASLATSVGLLSNLTTLVKEIYTLLLLAVVFVFSAINATSSLQSKDGTGDILDRRHIPSMFDFFAKTSEGMEQPRVFVWNHTTGGGDGKYYRIVPATPTEFSNSLTAGQIKTCYLVGKCFDSLPAKMKPLIRMID